MGLLAGLLRPRAAAPAPPPDADHWYDLADEGPTAAGVSVTPDSALRVASVFACVRLLANTIGSLPMFVYERLDRGKRKAAEHPLYGVLHGRPNEWQTPFEFRQMMQSHLCLRGNAYARIVPGVRGAVDQLIPLHPDRVDVFRIDNGRLGYTVGRPDSPARERLTQDEVFHLRGFSLDGMKGLSPVSLLRETVGSSMAAQSYGGTLFRNNARPAGALKTPNKLSREAKENLRATWYAAHGGPANAGKVAVLEEGLDWADIGMSNEDAQWIDFLKLGASDVAMIFGVPPHLIGMVEKTTSWGCLPGDTMVFTTSGPKPIESVRPGETVWSLGDSGLVPARVRAWKMTGVRPVLTIETQARRLRLTDNHRVLVRRYEGRGARKRGEAGWVNLWVPAGEVRPGDYMAVPHDVPSLGGTRTPCGRELTVGLMELFGLYLGDGSLDKNRVEIAHEEVPDHMGHYRDVVRREFGVEPYSDSRRTRWSSAECVRLLNHGFTGTALTKRVPGWVFGLARELQLGLLRGLVDSDGSIQRGRVVFSSACKGLLEDVRHLCMQVGVPVGRVVVGRKEGPTTIQGRVCHSQTKYVLNLSSLRHNAAVGSNSPHKAAALSAATPCRVLRYDEGWCGGYGRITSGDRLETTPGHEWGYDNLRLQKVQKVTAGEIAVPVYDISVEGTESFVADGLLVHNSGIEEQGIGFVTYTLDSWLTLWEQACDRDLLAEPESYYCKFLLNKLLRGDVGRRYAAYAVGRQWGWLSVNDVRELEEMNPVEGGDEYMAPLNMEPVGTPDGPAEEDPPAAYRPPARDRRTGGRRRRRSSASAAEIRPLLADAAERIASAECRGLAPRAPHAAADPARFREWLGEFYARHAAYAAKVLTPIADAWRLRGGGPPEPGRLASDLCAAAVRELCASDPAAAVAGWGSSRAGAVLALLEAAFAEGVCDG